MRVSLFFVFLLLSFSASAEHHRDHVSMHLADGHRFLSASINSAYSMKKYEALSDKELKTVNKFILYAEKYLRRLESAQVLAATPASDLDELRAKLNAPGNPAGVFDSVAWGINTVTSIWILLIDYESPNLTRVRLTIGYLRKANAFVDMASWHVQDAIREEIYGDPAFQ